MADFSSLPPAAPSLLPGETWGCRAALARCCCCGRSSYGLRFKSNSALLDVHLTLLLLLPDLAKSRTSCQKPPQLPDRRQDSPFPQPLAPRSSWFPRSDSANKAQAEGRSWLPPRCCQVSLYLHMLYAASSNFTLVQRNSKPFPVKGQSKHRDMRYLSSIFPKNSSKIVSSQKQPLCSLCMHSHTVK